MTTPATSAAFETIKSLWKRVSLEESILERLSLTGDPDKAAKSSFRVGHLAQASTALAGLAASAVLQYRNGTEAPKVNVDARHALLCFISEGYTIIDGALPHEIWDDLAGFYPTKDGHVRLHMYTNFRHHRQGILKLLECEDTPTRAAVGQALLGRNSSEFESEATAAGMCVSALRSFNTWDQHPQAAVLQGKPPIELIRIGDAPPRRRTNASMPLEGIRILEMTRIIAGPVAGRLMAGHGADVLWITSPNLPDLPVLDIETSRGKRAAQLDINDHQQFETLRELVSTADVFLQSYRPSSLSKRGLSPEELAKVNPGIVVANMRGYGWNGPWAEKRALDSLVQAAAGFNIEEGKAWTAHKNETEETPIPKVLPVQCLDHASGQLLAFGIMAALCKQMQEGGSWEVRVSLAGVGQWLRDLGQLSPNEAFRGKALPERTVSLDEEIRPLAQKYVVRNPTHRDQSLVALKPAAVLEGIPVPEPEVPSNLACDACKWK